MKRFIKGPCPDDLTNNWQRWGRRYAFNRGTNPNFLFQWPQLRHKRINVIIEPLLANDTQKHCSYCDNFPVREQEDSIDHFKPKTNSAFYEFVCHWNNLYYSCHHCQMSKGSQYSDLLLRPDSLEYDFDIYFTYNYTTHKIDINNTATVLNKRKAEYTRGVFGWDTPASADARRI